MYEMRPISLHESSQSLLNSSIVSPLIVPTIRGVPSSNTDMYHARLGAITPPVQHGVLAEERSTLLITHVYLTLELATVISIGMMTERGTKLKLVSG